MPAFRLFSWFILRSLRQDPLRSMTTGVGIALGVAVIVAIQLTNASSVAGFRTALDTISGRTSLEIVATGLGIDERRLVELMWLRDFGAVSPVVEGEMAVREANGPRKRLRVLGIDILRDRPFREYQLLDWSGASPEPRPQEFLDLLVDPGSAILAAKFASPRGLAVGSTLEVLVGDRRAALKVRGLLRDEGPARVLDGRFVLMDIAGAQQLLDRYGRVDRIDLRIPQGGDVSSAQARIAARLPSGLTVRRPAQRGEQVEQMLAAFHLNLTALSYVALLVGLFLVYNTVSVSVLSRWSEIGTLRAIGVSKAGVRGLFLGEAAVLSLVGATVGLFLGRLLADATVALTATAVSAIYIATAAAPPALQTWHVALAFGSAVPLALLAALVPAQEAATIPPAVALRGADQVDRHTRVSRRHLWVPGVLLGAAIWFATRGPVNGLPLFGYASALATVFGVSFLVPLILLAAVRGLVSTARRWLKVEDWLAVTNLSAAVPRLSISVAALAVSLSMMVAIAVMVGSFRETVAYWIGQTLQADLFVSPGTGRSPAAGEILSTELPALIAGSPGVTAVDRYRAIDVPYRDTVIRVGSGDFSVVLGHGSLLFKAPADARERMRAAIGENAVVVSEAFSLKQQHGIGDVIELPTDRGREPFTIAAIYYDYSSDRGVVMLDRTVFERHFDDRSTSGITVYLQDGIDPEEARARLLREIGDRHEVFINTNRSLRIEVLRIFDSTFAITYALELIAIIVAISGVSGTLLTLVLERERELMILRLVGTERRQIRRMVVGEAIIIGAISHGLGLIVGLALSLLLIFVVNVQSFGWTIQFHWPIAFIIQSTLLILIATALAGLYPAYRASRLTMVHEE
ncbi:MAG: ABC transporter permease [Acidimicrobiia bacterium]|nr:ABC transporter permease [Acidimicrobiia bacterium]